MNKIISTLLSFCLVTTMIMAVSVSVSAAGGETFVPLEIASGYTVDIVVEDGSTIQNGVITTAVPFDGDNNGANTTLYEETLTINGNSGSYGLPAGGLVTFTDGGQDYQYQLGDYSGNNAVQISRNGTTSGSFVFVTPGAYDQISILGAAGNGAVSFSATVVYTDGSTEHESFTAPDWGTNAYCVVGRIKIKNLGGIDSPAVGVFDDYRAALYHFEVDTDTSKLVKQINFTYVSSGPTARANLVAVSGVVPAGVPAAPAAAAASNIGSTGFTANWGTVAGATDYRLDVSTSPDFDTILSNYDNLSVGNVNTYAVTGLQTGTTYYYRVRAVNSDGQSISSNAISAQTTTGGANTPVSNITGVPTSATAGADLSLGGTVAPAGATNQTIVWSVKDAGTTGATITGGKLSTTGAGTVVVTATITDGLAAGSNYTQDFTITVTGSAPAKSSPTITTTGLPNGTVQKNYSFQLAATGDTPITWALESGSLPLGLSLSADGTLSGTPTETGDYHFTVKASNAVGTATKEFSLSIRSESSGRTSGGSSSPSNGNSVYGDSSVSYFGPSFVGVNDALTFFAPGSKSVEFDPAYFSSEGATGSILTPDENGNYTLTALKEGVTQLVFRSESGTRIVEVTVSGGRIASVQDVTAQAVNDNPRTGR